MRCEICKGKHDGSFGSGRFCSKACSCKVGGFKVGTDEKRKNGSEKTRKANLTRAKTLKKFILKTKFDKLEKKHIKKRVLFEQEEKCLLCGISEWQEKSIVLQLDHINGNHQDNSRENLRCLCPNCHSQTDTFCGKNSNTGKKKVTEEQWQEAIKNGKNKRQILLSLNLAAKGVNYHTIDEKCKKYNIHIGEKYDYSETEKDRQRIKTLENKLQKNELIKKRQRLIECSNIDFSKSGWSLKVAQLWEIRHQRVAYWIKKICPDIWLNAWKRKGTKE